MDEFSQSRFRLESRYHHVLVDEFQDTSRAQWELVSLLVQAWGEGLGARDQSLDLHRRRSQAVDLPVPRRRGRRAGAGRAVHRRARPDRRSRRSIARSFRAVPDLLHFVNDLFTEMSQPARIRASSPTRSAIAFRSATRRFRTPGAREPVARPGRRGHAGGVRRRGRRGGRDRSCGTATVRDKATGIAAAGPGRRHRHPVPLALEPSGIRARAEPPRHPHLRLQGARLLRRRRNQGRRRADPLPRRPSSPLRAAAFMRSRFVRLSDGGAHAARARAGGGPHAGARVAARVDAIRTRRIGACSNRCGRR